MGVACAWVSNLRDDTWASTDHTGSRHTSPTPKEMSEEQLKAFWEAVQADAGLQEKLSAAKDADAVVAIAETAGFDVSKADWLKHVVELLELSDEELERAAGGGYSYSSPFQCPR